jgi:hypothetical protein
VAPGAVLLVVRSTFLRLGGVGRRAETQEFAGSAGASAAASTAACRGSIGLLCERTAAERGSKQEERPNRTDFGQSGHDDVYSMPRGTALSNL